MKIKAAVLIILLSMVVISGFAQEKSKKQQKEELKTSLQALTEELINTKEFIFVANLAMPAEYPILKLDPNNNFMRFHPDRIESFMPYFGKRYNYMGFDGDETLKFDVKPDKYTITKGKRNYMVRANVTLNNDLYHISLLVSLGGSTTLTITTANRSGISYSGHIESLEILGDAK